MLGGDPVFVLDLVIDEKHRDPDCLVTAHAALDALSTFGGVASPLVTFHLESVRKLLDLRPTTDGVILRVTQAQYDRLPQGCGTTGGRPV